MNWSKAKKYKGLEFVDTNPHAASPGYVSACKAANKRRNKNKEFKLNFDKYDANKITNNGKYMSNYSPKGQDERGTHPISLLSKQSEERSELDLVASTVDKEWALNSGTGKVIKNQPRNDHQTYNQKTDVSSNTEKLDTPEQPSHAQLDRTRG